MNDRRQKYIELPGHEPTIKILGKYQATESILKKMKAEITSQDCKIETLEIQQNQMTNDKMVQLCEAIKGNTSLKTVIINHCHMRANSYNMLFQAIIDQQDLQTTKIQCIQLKQMKINRESAVMFGQCLMNNIQIVELHLIDVGLDSCGLIEIAKGLKYCILLEFLDLRKNLFDQAGLEAIIKALTETMSIKHLYLEGTPIDVNEAQLLSDFFSKNTCMIEELEINEAEIDCETIDIILRGTFKADHLKRLSLSKNYLSPDIIQIIKQVMIQLHNFQSLCLSRCEIGKEGLQILCEGFKNQHSDLKFLDLSWNNIDQEGMADIFQMLKYDRSLEKILLQHNQIGVEGARLLVDALEENPQVRYLDISANDITSEGFNHFKKLFQKNKTQLQNLHVRKNQIEGRKILAIPESLKNNNTLFYLDLKDNEIDDECATELIKLIEFNYFIEDLVIKGNQLVSYVKKEQINQECRKNLLIKQYIIPRLHETQQHNTQESGIKSKQNHWENYEVDSLILEDEKYKSSDFIVKFMMMNKKNFHSLEMNNVVFDEHIEAFVDYLTQCNLNDEKIQQSKNDPKLTQEQKQEIAKIEMANIESISLIHVTLCNPCMSKLVQCCGNIRTLKELRLSNMNIDFHLDEIFKVLSNHESLQILDISDNEIENYEVLQYLLMFNQSIRQLTMRGIVIEKKEYLQNLLDGVRQNFLIRSLDYTVSDELTQTCQKEMAEVSEHLEINEWIYNNLIINEIKNHNLNNQKLDCKGKNISGRCKDIIKYYRYRGKKILNPLKLLPYKDPQAMRISLRQTQINRNQLLVKNEDHQVQGVTKRKTVKSILYLRNCSITGQTMQDLIQQIMARTQIEIEELDLSHNDCIDNNDCKYLAKLIEADKSIKKISLIACNNITIEGIKYITKALSQNNHLDELNFQQCNGIKITDIIANDAEEIIQNDLLSDIEEEKEDQVLSDPDVAVRKHQSLSNDKKVKFKSAKNILKAKSKEDEDSDNSSSSISGEDDSKGKDTDKNTDPTSLFSIDKQSTTLSLKNLGITNLDFLSKYMRLNPDIMDVDIGDNPDLNTYDVNRFLQRMQKNKSVMNINLEGTNIDKSTQLQIQEQVKQNQQIKDLINENLLGENKDILKIEGHKLQKLDFLQKFMQDFKHLKKLDLTNNQLGNAGAEEITQLISESKDLRMLKLKGNGIGPTGLKYICSALTKHTKLEVLDIRQNPIDDSALKMLLPLLYYNKSLYDIKYDLKDEHHIKLHKEFAKNIEKNVNDREETLNRAINKFYDDHEHQLSCKQKACLPLWCWKSFIHDKHEAFRYRYDSTSLHKIEDELMDTITKQLYVSSIVYYLIMLIFPNIFVEECGEGLNIISHFIYIFYAVSTFIFEIYTALKIQTTLNNPDMLKFNKWHFVEILMGQIARFDTYLDVCFLVLLIQCEQLNLMIPVSFFIIIFLSRPLYVFLNLWFNPAPHRFHHTLPKLERGCQIAFLREYMLLATIFDSFSIDNTEEICGIHMTFGRFQGLWTLATQDGPQYLIHLLFLFFVESQIPHSQLTVILSLIVSSCAVPISIFNCIMCTPNEFNPIVIKQELRKRWCNHAFMKQFPRTESNVKLHQERILQLKNDVLNTSQKFPNKAAIKGISNSSTRIANTMGKQKPEIKVGIMRKNTANLIEMQKQINNSIEFSHESQTPALELFDSARQRNQSIDDNNNGSMRAKILKSEKILEDFDSL